MVFDSDPGVAPTSVSISGSEVTLITLASAANVQNHVIVSYTVPSDDPIQDSAGNDAVALSSETVPNFTPNDPPTFDSGLASSFSVDEGTPANTEIGDPYSATDPEGVGVTMSLAGTDASSFTVDLDTGQLKTAVALDYETKTSYSIIVQVTDGKSATNEPDGGAIDAVMFPVTININNIDEAGTVTLPGTITAGSPVTATLSDPDGTDASSESWEWSRGRHRQAGRSPPSAERPPIPTRPWPRTWAST